MSSPVEAAGLAVRPHAAPDFDLLRNPFAVLGAAPGTPVAELPALARRIGGQEAAAAARLLSVPRPRLAAEIAFLPGAADRIEAILGSLRRAERPDFTGLPDAAVANLAAHLCAAGLAEPADEVRLASAQSAPGAPALLTAINADRKQAGVPATQPDVLAAEQATLADRHAACLVHACLRGEDGAARMTAIVATAADGTALLFLRRVTAAWARQGTSRLGTLEEQASVARLALLKQPGVDTLRGLVDAVQAWAALDAPCLLSDARAGLDHPAALRALRPWTGAVTALTEQDRPELALQLAQALAGCFAALPGEAPRLDGLVRQTSRTLEDSTLDGLLTPLRTVAARVAADPSPLVTALGSSPFGPGAPGVAGELWTAFDAACSACVDSEAPWIVLRSVADRLVVMPGHQPAQAVVVLQRGVIGRADAAGRPALADRIRAVLPGLEGQAALLLYAHHAKATGGWGWRQTARTLAALRGALALTEDPQQRDRLLAEQRALRQRQYRGFVLVTAIAALVGIGVMLRWLDGNYAQDAPYRHSVAQMLAGAGPAPAPAPMPPADQTPVSANPLAALQPVVVRPPFAQPAPVQPAPIQPAPDHASHDGAEHVQPPADASPIAFLTHTHFPEKQPSGGPGLRSLAEVRWCQFNGVRLDAALENAFSLHDTQGVLRLQQIWQGVCHSIDTRRAIADRVLKEVDLNRDLLEDEGHAMVHGSKAIE